MKSDHLVLVRNRVAEFCVCCSFCVWWCEIVFSGIVGKVNVGNIIVLYSEIFVDL